jgi:hypothetical protein
VYFVRIQTFVLAADVIINTLMVFLIGIEFFLAIYAIIKFKRADKVR